MVLHAHVLPVVTATATLSPPAGDVRLVGAIVNVQGAPACVTLNVWPAIVTDPVRCAVPVFAATVTLTLPLPVLPDPTVNHAALLVVLHAQVLPVVTATATLSPAAGEVRLVGAIVNVHGAPAWLTVYVWPAMVSVPVRGVVAVFAAIEKPTVPLPDPAAPEVIVSQAALLAAVQAQPAAALTPTVRVDVVATTETLVPDSVGAQTGVYENWFERLLLVDPPGPSAATFDSNITPVGSAVVSSETKSSLIRPSVPGAGLPRSTDATTVVVPAL